MLPKGSGNLEDIATIMIPRSVRRQTMVLNAVGLLLLGASQSVFVLDLLSQASPHSQLLQSALLASSPRVQSMWEDADAAVQRFAIQPAAKVADTHPQRIAAVAPVYVRQLAKKRKTSNSQDENKHPCTNACEYAALPSRVFDPPPNFFSNTTGVEGRPVFALEGAQTFYGPWQHIPLKFVESRHATERLFATGNEACKRLATLEDLLWWDAPHVGGSPVWLSRMLRGIMDGLQPVLDLIDRPAYEASLSAAFVGFVWCSTELRNGDVRTSSEAVKDRLLRALESEILAAHEKEVTAANAEPIQPPPSETATDRVILPSPSPPKFGECSETADHATVPPKAGECESAATSSNHTPVKRYAPSLKLTLSEGSLAENEEIQGFGGSLPRQFHLWSTYTRPLAAKREHDFAIHMRDDGEEEDMAISAGVDEFARELEQEKKIRSQAKTPRWVLSPNSPKRICWDLLGVIVLLYDLIMIPLYTAFPLQDNIFLSMMTGITLAFWSLDILACFCVGYYAKDGTLVVSLARIAKQYLLSWFPLDVVIVSIDWIIVLALVTEEEGKSAGLMRAGKMLRALRVLRTLRLLRLAKLRQLLQLGLSGLDQVDSEHISVLLDIVKLLILIIFINHFIACAWYLVGCNPPQNESSWLVAEFSVISCDDPVDELLLYKYTTAMHWSFAIGVLLFALLVFSSFVASLTGATTSLRKMTGRHSSQLWLLRKFLRQRGISLDLQVRINRYINVVLTNTQRYVQYSDVELFGHLSGPLHNELQTELNKPRLLIHPFFVNMLDKFEALMRKVCCSVPVEMALSRGDVLFNGGEEAQHMYFLCSGGLTDFVREGDYWHVESRTFHSLGAEQWFCEAVLWTPWVHQGRVRAKSETELISLSSAKFRDVLSEYPKHMSFMRMYGLVFLSQLQDWYEVSQRLTDLDMDVSVSATTTDFLQLELADVESEAPSLRDDQKSVVSGSSSFWPARSASHQTVGPSPQARYRRAKSKQLLKMSESDILETQSDHGPGFLTAVPQWHRKEGWRALGFAGKLPKYVRLVPKTMQYTTTAQSHDWWKTKPADLSHLPWLTPRSVNFLITLISQPSTESVWEAHREGVVAAGHTHIGDTWVGKIAIGNKEAHSLSLNLQFQSDTLIGLLYSASHWALLAVDRRNIVLDMPALVYPGLSDQVCMDHTKTPQQTDVWSRGHRCILSADTVFFFCVLKGLPLPATLGELQVGQLHPGLAPLGFSGD
eukprot:s4345_g3.t1